MVEAEGEVHDTAEAIRGGTNDMDVDDQNDNENDNGTAAPDEEEDDDEGLSPSGQAEQDGLLVIPSTNITSIEHPCIIKNIDRAINALGGEHQIKHILKDDASVHVLPPATSLRPDDVFAKKISAQSVNVDHVLLRVTIPKRTGRKRKRGTDGPFEFHDGSRNGHRDAGQSDPGSTLPMTAEQLVSRLSGLKDDDLDIEPVGAVREAHRFRGLPDFQLVSRDSDILAQVGNKLVNPTLAKIKSFKPDMSVNRTPTHMIGPPQFGYTTQQLYYGYAQGGGTRTTIDADGKATSTNTGLPRRRAGKPLRMTIAQVPRAPPSSLPKLSTCTDELRTAVETLNAILTTRPISTRRALTNLAPQVHEAVFKEAVQYIGYSFRTGPWRDTIIRWGVDPRTSPSYRAYQTLSFQTSLKDRNLQQAKQLATGSQQWLRSYKAPPLTSPLPPHADHVFDGARLGVNKTWQVLDVVEPTLRAVLADAPARPDPDWDVAGWFPNGRLAVARAVMKDMLAALAGGDDGGGAGRFADVYRRAAGVVPDTVHEGNLDACYFSDDWGLSRAERAKGAEIMAGVRVLCKGDKAWRGVRERERAAVESREGREDEGAGDDAEGEGGVRRASTTTEEMDSGSDEEEEGEQHDDEEEGEQHNDDEEGEQHDDDEEDERD